MTSTGTSTDARTDFHVVHAHAHIRKEILSEPGVVAHLPVILSAAESEADPNPALGYRMCLRSVGSLVRPCLKHSLLRNRKEERGGGREPMSWPRLIHMTFKTHPLINDLCKTLPSHWPLSALPAGTGCYPVFLKLRAQLPLHGLPRKA